MWVPTGVGDLLGDGAGVQPTTILGTAGVGDGTTHGITPAGMTGDGMAVIAIIHGPIGDVLGVATGAVTGAAIGVAATGEDHIIGIMAGMDITTIVVTTDAVQA